MNLLDRLEKRYRGMAIPNLTMHLVAAQVIAYVLTMYDLRLRELMLFIPAAVWDGELWRLITFIVVPPLTNLVFAAFGWYLFFLMGTALDGHWGSFRYNLYLLIAYVATIAVSFLSPFEAWSNAFIGGSVFLAFAHLYPDFTIMVFFVLPVRIKWLALLTWLGYAVTLIFGSWPARLSVLAATSNYLIFFGRDLWALARSNRTRMERGAREFADRNKPFHRCTVCGITDKTHPDMEFRYCRQCKGTVGYCTEHLRNHEHI